jgi:hypothetical protein
VDSHIKLFGYQDDIKIYGCESQFVVCPLDIIVVFQRTLFFPLPSNGTKKIRTISNGCKTHVEIIVVVEQLPEVIADFLPVVSVVYVKGYWFEEKAVLQTLLCINCEALYLLPFLG